MKKIQYESPVIFPVIIKVTGSHNIICASNYGDPGFAGGGINEEETGSDW